MSAPQTKGSFVVLPKIINGGIAGIIGVTCVFPLDLVKTRLQSQKIGPNGERMYTSMYVVGEQRGVTFDSSDDPFFTFPNRLDCFRKTFASEGFFGMYRGSFINILLITPEKAIKLAFNDFFRYQLASPDGKISLGSQCLAGGLAGFFQIIVTTPMELLKIQMQAAGQNPASKDLTAFTIAKKMVQENGIFGLYKGVRATAARDVTFSMMYFPLFASLNDAGPRKPGTSGEAIFWWSLVSGLISGMVSAIAVTPLDVIKTRLQASDNRYTGVVDCIRRTLSEEGPKAFFNGGLCRIMVIAPVFGIVQMVYFMGIGERILGIQQKKSI